MIGWIALRLAGAGVPDRFARAVAWTLIVALIAIAIVLAIGARDRRMIEGHDATQRADQAEAQVERTQQAETGELAARKVDQANAEQVKGAIDNAVTANPEAVRAGVGPATSAALDELRRRQARQRGQ